MYIEGHIYVEREREEDLRIKEYKGICIYVYMHVFHGVRVCRFDCRKTEAPIETRSYGDLWCCEKAMGIDLETFLAKLPGFSHESCCCCFCGRCYNHPNKHAPPPQELQRLPLRPQSSKDYC